MDERGSFIGRVRGKLEKVGIVLSENVLDFLVDDFLDLFGVVGITLGCRGVFVPFIIFDFGGKVEFEIRIGVIGSWFLTPFLAGTGEKSCVADVFICEANELRVGD